MVHNICIVGMETKTVIQSIQDEGMISGTLNNNMLQIDTGDLNISKDPLIIQVNTSLTDPSIENSVQIKMTKCNDWNCPISGILMKDPVVAQDGYSYERSTITEWLSKNSTSPMNRSSITNKSLYPNIGVKLLIEQYIKENPSEDKKDTELDQYLDEQIMTRQKPTTIINSSNPYLHISYVTIPGWNVIREMLGSSQNLSPQQSSRVAVVP